MRERERGYTFYCYDFHELYILLIVATTNHSRSYTGILVVITESVYSTCLFEQMLYDSLILFCCFWTCLVSVVTLAGFQECELIHLRDQAEDLRSWAKE